MSSAPDDAMTKRIELEVGRLFREDAGKHRAHLETLFRWLTWALGILVAAGLGMFLWFFGDTRSEVRDQIKQSVETRFLDYEFDKELMAKLEARIADVAVAEANSAKTRASIDKIVDEYIATGAKKYLDDEAMPRIKAATDETVERMQRLDVRELVTLPVATIVPYPGSVLAGNDVPAGWLLCDGRAVPENTDDANYDKLRQLLRATAWGNEGAEVHVPDLRGMFLRGVDDPDGPAGDKWTAAGNDQEPGSRYDPASKKKTDAVGSVQLAATGNPSSGWEVSGGGHSHTIDLYYIGGTESGTAAAAGNGNAKKDGSVGAGAHTHSITSGDKETRPINAYVNFIIKY